MTSTGTSLLCIYKTLISRWESERERELFNDGVVHVLQNTLNSHINSATACHSAW